MSLADLKRRLRDLRDGPVAATLGGAGFVPAGDLFVRRGPVNHFVELTRAPRPTAFGLRFDFEVGACLGALGPDPVRRDMLYTAGHPVILRPLALLSGGSATGYPLTPDDDAAALGGRVASDLTAFALPWCAATATLDGLVATLAAEDAAAGANVNAYMGALLLAKAGRRDEARDWFGRAEGPRELVEASARAWGIDL